MSDAREHHFTAPGTWTWPGTISHVTVTLIGGGGGGGATSPPPGAGGFGGGGGGGGFRREVVPVSGPVPVVVGSGGAGGLDSPVPTNTNGSPGGSSSFGSFSVGGGAGGGGYATGTGLDAASDGGGGGGASTGSPSPTVGAGGAYGYPGSVSSVTGPAANQFHGGMGGGAFNSGTIGVFIFTPSTGSIRRENTTAGRGIDGYAGGGRGASAASFEQTGQWGQDGGGYNIATLPNNRLGTSPYQIGNGYANKGGGGSAGKNQTPRDGGAGGSGRVIVEY